MGNLCKSSNKTKHQHKPLGSNLTSLGSTTEIDETRLIQRLLTIVLEVRAIIKDLKEAMKTVYLWQLPPLLSTVTSCK